MKKRSFKDYVCDAIDEDIDIRFRPDKWEIDKEHQVIRLYEYVKSNDLNENKLNLLGKFWFDCDANGWDVELTVSHWYGASSKIDLQEIYYNKTLIASVTKED